MKRAENAKRATPEKFAKRALLCITVLFCLCLMGPGLRAQAASCRFWISTDREEASEGEVFALDLFCDCPEPIGAFLVKISYPEEMAEFSSCEKSEALAGGTADYYDSDGVTSFVFAAGRDTEVFGSGLQLLRVRYRAKQSGSADFTVELLQAVGTEGQPLIEEQSLSASVWVREPDPSEALLLELSSPQGEFHESFSPDRTAYTMDVPYTTTQVFFDWVCSPGASAAVNRRNLGSGGSTTEFRITVTAPDGETKNRYTVSVRRGAYSPNAAGEAPELLSLIPSAGVLEPEFSPEIFEYTLAVPYEVRTLEFETSCSPGATVRVNRKNLGSGGSTVNFLLTVSSGARRTTYTVAVSRGVYRQDGAAGDGSGEGGSYPDGASGSAQDLLSPNAPYDREESAALFLVNDGVGSFLLGGVTVLAAAFAGILLTLLFLSAKTRDVSREKKIMKTGEEAKTEIPAKTKDISHEKKRNKTREEEKTEVPAKTRDVSRENRINKTREEKTEVSAKTREVSREKKRNKTGENITTEVSAKTKDLSHEKKRNKTEENIKTEVSAKTREVSREEKINPTEEKD